MNEGIALPHSKQQAVLQKIAELYQKLETVQQRIKQESVHIGENANSGRLLLVTHKLPFQLHYAHAADHKGWKAVSPPSETFNEMTKNCASAHADRSTIWIGWPGAQVEPWEQTTIRQQLLTEHRFYPVFLNPQKQALFYEGYCKSVLWPLFHSSPPTTDDVMANHDVYAEYGEGSEDRWEAYVSVNRRYAEAIHEFYRDGDIVWIHDYHLMLVPLMLRNLIPQARIGFFLHIPFPSSELYRSLPAREELLKGVLQADLIGFQTYQYARHFFSSCEGVLGLECSSKGVEYNGHFAQVCITPVGIDPQATETLARSDTVQGTMRKWQERLKHRRVLFGIDELESTMGLVHKLLAIEELFSENPQLSKEVVFVQVVLLGAGMRREQQLLESQLHAMVIRINSKLNSLDVEGPLQFLSTSLAVEEIIALYCIAEVLVVTPIRDGMNVRPFEYVVCRQASGKPATVVLSEFAGCARSLGGAILVNPWDTAQVTQAMLAALNMEFRDRIRAHDNMVQYVYNFTSALWISTFTEQLRETAIYAERTAARELHLEHVLQAYQETSRRLLLFGLEGVLCERCSLPELVRVRDTVLDNIARLASMPENTVVIKSARTREVLDRIFGKILERAPAHAHYSEDSDSQPHMNLVLAAEDGLFVRHINHPNWHQTFEMPCTSGAWRHHVMQLLEHFTERTPGSLIEEKDSGLAWHYRDSDVAHGGWQARQVQVSIMELGKKIPISVFIGDRVVEVKPQWASHAASNFLHWVIDRVVFGDLEAASVKRLLSLTPSTLQALSPPQTRSTPGLASKPSTRKLTSFSFSSDNLPLEETKSTVTGPESQGSPTQIRELDFVLVLTSGNDANDEDIFEALAPEPFFIDQVEHATPEGFSIQPPEPRSAGQAGQAAAASSSAPAAGGSAESSTGGASAGATPPSRLARLNEAALAMLGMKGDSRPPTPAGGFPSSPNLVRRASLMSDASASRIMSIKETGSYAPRTDFPPAGLLFKAMRRRYGENFDRNEIPDTPAACWALVLSTDMEGTGGTNTPTSTNTWSGFPWERSKTLRRASLRNLFREEAGAAGQDAKFAQRPSQLYREPMNVTAGLPTASVDIPSPPPMPISRLAPQQALHRTTTTPPPTAAAHATSPRLPDAATERPVNPRLDRIVRPELGNRSISAPPVAPLMAQPPAPSDVSESVAESSMEPPRSVVSEIGSSAVSSIPEAKLPVNTFSCIIGMRLSQAHNYLKNSAVALHLIDSMANMIIIDIDSLGRPIANIAAQSSPNLPSLAETAVAPEPLRRSATMIPFNQR